MSGEIETEEPLHPSTFGAGEKGRVFVKIKEDPLNSR